MENINKYKYGEYRLILGKVFDLNVYLFELLAINYKRILLASIAKSLIKDDSINRCVRWINDEEIINNKFHRIIISEPPQKQYNLIYYMSLWKNYNHLILEKPIANNHEKAKYLINILNKNKNQYSINYSFRYTFILGKRLYD